MKHLLLLLATALGCAAQPRAFDVASVKPSPPGSTSISMRTADGRLTASNVPLLQLIQSAFHIKDFQVSGGLPWMTDARYDIDARMEKRDIGDDALWLSLQPLLVDRFHLKFHRDTKQLPVFSLTVTKGGPKFVAHKESIDGKDKPRFGVSIGAGKGKLTASKTTMSRFVDSLGNQVDRIVIDRTGLTGEYDFTVEWSPENHEGSLTGAIAEKTGLIGPNIFEALQDQLGLRLESAKGPVPIVVIDSVEKATAN